MQKNTFIFSIVVMMVFSGPASYTIYCQNLIPNPSFETLVGCPTGAGQVSLAEGWEAVLTPDLYNVCATAVPFQVPLNQYCNYLPPHDGDGYVGMYVYNSNEFIRTVLLDTLEAGKFYYVRFFVAPDDNCSSSTTESFTDGIGLAVKGFGSDDEFKIVAENRGVVLNDTANWTKISGCFVADGNELIAQIGNFLDNDSTLLETDSPLIPNSQQFNYMYVDDVVLTPFDPFPDTVLLCDGQPVNLDATFFDADFEWVTGETSPFLLAFDTGSYEVIAKIDGCTLREKVQVVNLNYASLSPPDTSICLGSELRLRPDIPGDYRWKDGSATKSFLAKKEAQYEAVITNTCGEFEFKQQVNTVDCRCRLFVPNIFSPNGDGINDELRIGFGCDFPYLPKRFELYDRWGMQVFATNDPLGHFWDGNLGGKPLQQGIYSWFFIYDMLYENVQREVLEEGNVMLAK